MPKYFLPFLLFRPQHSDLRPVHRLQHFRSTHSGKQIRPHSQTLIQIQNLPEKRLAHQNYWDNIGGYFEDYELEGDFGDYRVMKREIPTAYSVTSIVTGYYKNGEWIWKNYFRPIYSFPGGETNEHQPLK